MRRSSLCSSIRCSSVHAKTSSCLPRDFDRDVALTESAGVGLVFAPPVEEMYPVPLLTTVAVREMTEPFEGETRPTHFAGVTTVVAKLFNLVGPCRGYFGEKDWQHSRSCAEWSTTSPSTSK